MAEENAPTSDVPVSDKALRELAKNVAKRLPNFAEKEPATALKELHTILAPVLETADLTDLENSHRAAASNALCGIIEYCAASDSAYAREAILDDSVWMRTFNIYLQRSGDAKGKSMRQMLLVLTSVVTKDQSLRANELRRRATSSFLDIICEREDRIKVKPALQGLAHFLLRDVISITELIGLFDVQLKRTSDTVQDAVTSRTVFKSFLAWVVHHDTALSTGHLIKNYLLQARRLADYDERGNDGSISPFWIEPVVQTLQDWPDRIQEFRTHVFPHCFLPNLSEYLKFLAYLHFESHVPHENALPSQLYQAGGHTSSLGEMEEFRILLAAIATGKELNIVKDNDYRVQSDIEIRDGALYLPDNVPGAWMADPHPEVRLAGMFLCVYSTSVTRAISGGILQALRRNLFHLHTDTDANFRREVHGYTQKLFDRLRASTATLAKSRFKGGASSQTRLPFPKTSSGSHGSIAQHGEQDPLSESLAFIAWYIQFLEWELRPTASYQSRITALRSITIVLRSGIDPGVPFTSLSKSAQGQLNWTHELRIGNTKLCRSLLDLILDPFDDVRDAAASVLQLCLVALPRTDQERTLSMIPRFLARAEATMLRTGRADQADGVARAYGMVFALASDESNIFAGSHFSSKQSLFEHLKTQLQDTLNLAHADLSKAVDGRPVHGTFAALRYVVDQPDFYSTISSLPPEVFTIWKRSHGEIVASIESLWSCVYHVLCADAPEGHVPDELEDESSLDTKEILSYSWRGLKEASVLLRTVILKAPETLRSIQAKSDAITRRSAGIPAAMSALLAAEPQAGGKLFPRAIKDLVAETLVEAQSTNIEESRLPQVHALNCIKEIFTTSKLSVASEAYIGQGLELAAKTLNSSIWPLRNCSLMLFKALIERLLGSDEAQDWKERERAKTSRFSYDNYPSLVKILIELLEPSSDVRIMETPEAGSSPMDLHGAEGVFPALQILRQARPPGDLTKIRSLVRELLPSPHWHMRDMAARTYVSLHTTNEHHEKLSPILDTVPSDHNGQHGRLLVVMYLLRKLLRDETQCILQHFAALMEQLGQHATSWYMTSDCPFVRAAFLDVVSICGKAMLQRANTISIIDAWKDLTTSITIGPEYEIGPSDRHGDALLRTSLAQVYMIDRVILRNDSLQIMVSDDYQTIGDALMLLANEDPDTCLEALETLDTILQMKASHDLTVPLSLVLAHIHRVVLEATDPEVISKSQAVLADALANNNLKSEFFSLVNEDQTMITLNKLQLQCIQGPPSNMQSAVHLLGSFLDHSYHTYPLRSAEILAAIARYIRLLRMTIDRSSPLAPSGKATGSLVLGLAIVLYDLLNDDDDEIRDLAASTTGSFLRLQGKDTFKDTVPISTTHRLAAYLITAFSTSQYLATEAIRRLTNTHSPTLPFYIPFAETFAQEREEDTSLFAQEKQNLYKDDTLDTILWSRILCSLSSSATPESLRIGLTTWVLDGLTTLMQTAEKEGDGALGWSTKAEVFTLGMRIFCASEVVMKWGGGEKVEVVKMLSRFSEVGTERGIHGLWIERVQGLLSREVKRMLRRAKAGLLDIGF
ncbi:unnamed protein product [Alternaria alternata]